MVLDPRKKAPMLSWPLSRALTALAFVLLAASAGSLGWLLGQVDSLANKVEHLAVENEQMRFADEGMLRSRTNYARPGVTEEQVQMIRAISEDYGIPEDILYAFYRTERGRRGLYMGANRVSPEIRKRYPPLWWQFAMAAKIWNQHLNKTVAFDLYVQRRTIWSFAKQWNPDPDNWTASAMANLVRTRANGLEVTEPPKARDSVISSKEAEAKASKAIGAGQNRPKHTSKEKKR